MSIFGRKLSDDYLLSCIFFYESRGIERLERMKRASAVLILDRGMILATARRDNKDDWNLPGGKCEEGESFEDAAIRECQEETTFRIYDLHFVFERQDDIYIVKTFIPEKYYGDIPTNEEQEKRNEPPVKWVTIEELLAGSFGDYNRNLLKTLKVIK